MVPLENGLVIYGKKEKGKKERKRKDGEREKTIILIYGANALSLLRCRVQTPAYVPKKNPVGFFGTPT